MKKYQFKLEKVLKVKTIELDTLTAVLNHIRYEIKQVEHRIQELNQAHIELEKAYIVQINKSFSGSELRQYNFNKETIKYQIEQCTNSLKELKLKENIQLNKVVEKKKEENILSKLDEKQFEQYTKQALKKENQILDEMLVMKMNFKG